MFKKFEKIDRDDYKTKRLSDLSGKFVNTIPYTEETLEEKERVEDNDPGMDTKRGRGGKFVSIEDIEGDILEEDSEQNENLEQDEEKINKLREEIKNKPINFFQNNTDVAHIGPDFENNDFNDNKLYERDSVIKDEAINGPDEEQEIQESFRIEKDKHQSFLDKIKHSFGDLFRKDYRRENKHWKSSKDNLKTMPDSKKERMVRGELREMNRDNKNYEDPYEREEDELLDQVFGVADLEEDKFKGDPEIQKLQEKEEENINNTKYNSDYRVGELEKFENKDRGIS